MGMYCSWEQWLQDFICSMVTVYKLANGYMQSYKDLFICSIYAMRKISWPCLLFSDRLDWKRKAFHALTLKINHFSVLWFWVGWGQQTWNRHTLEARSYTAISSSRVEGTLFSQQPLLAAFISCEIQGGLQQILNYYLKNTDNHKLNRCEINKLPSRMQQDQNNDCLG